MINYTIKLGIAGLLISCIQALADADSININWERLNLTPKQERSIQVFDKEWQQMKSLIRPKLIRDQERLKLMLANPDVSDVQIRELQKQIFVKQEQLRYEALENFLAKRRLLNSHQREILHEMLSRVKQF